jgi:ABC-type glycerol-3-phosphate transport system substrate-binding protein
MLRNILLGLGVFAALFSVLIFSGKLPIGKGGEAKAVGEVVMWGTVPAISMNALLQAYNAQAKSYRISYKEFQEDSFPGALVEALANGAGPDMILAPHTQILAQANRLYPFPSASLSEKKYKDTYVDGASVFWTPQGAIALPVTVDPMVLFYNRRLFSLKGIVSPPKYWDEISKLSPALTQTNSRGQFVQSGIDLGGVTTPHTKDILMSIVTQLGQAPTIKQYGPDGVTQVAVTADTPLNQSDQIRPLSTALRYFAQFSDPAKVTYSWNDFSGSADDAFVAEKLAMYLGYAGEYASLQARNPKASFDFTYFPQTRDYNTFATAARFYGVATLKTSKNPVAALTAESVFASSGVAPSVAAAVQAFPALRASTADPTMSEVVARSNLVASTWFDTYPAQSTALVQSMVSDVINNRRGPAEAASLFISRLQALYTGK